MSYVAFRALLVLFSAVVFGAFGAFVASRPTRLPSRLGMRGLRRQRALLDPTWATIEPFVRWTGVRVSGLVGDKLRAHLDRALLQAGDYRGLTPDEYFASILLAALAGGAAGTIATVLDGRLALAVPTLAAIGAFVPHIVVDDARVQRFRAIHRGLPYAIDLMALGMSAGLDFPGALQQVVSKAKANDALRDELEFILQQFQLGRTRSQVLKELAVRVPIESVREFVHALVQADERGTPVVNALEIQATNARIRRATLAENAASDMKAKMLLPTMMIVGVSLTLIALPSSMMMEKLSSQLSGAAR